MTGFTPFFHNTVHSNNFTQWIAIISNPAAKGTERIWKDSYPDKLARFEQDVLKDDKVVSSGSCFKTKVFIPKRDVFPTADYGDKNNIDDVRDALGKLVIYGYKFRRGQLQMLTNTGATPNASAGPRPY